MAQQRSAHQERIIRNYYKNRDGIALQKISELVTDLYLAEGKSREKVWDRITKALANAGLKPARIDHLRKQDDPAAIAKVVEELMASEEGK